MLATIALLFCLILVMLLFLVYIIIAFDHMRSGLAPAISTPDSALKTICTQLTIRESDEIMELGCGDARVISYCANNYPKASFVGIENGIIMLLRAKWNTKHQNNVTIKFGNLKSVSLKHASKMYLYLLPEALRIVKPNIPKGCTVVSLEFKFSNKKPSGVVKLPRSSKFAHKLFIYKF